MIRIALSSQYMEALTQLTPNEQNLANKALLKFQMNKDASGLNYEKLTAFKDKKLRSIRANQDVRIILAVAEENSMYLVLYVDHHDSAYKWAENRKIKIHPDTGILQVYSAVETEVITSGKSSDELAIPGVYDHVRDKHLLQLGIPGDLLPLIRAIRIEADLDKVMEETQLSSASYDGLYMLMAGSSIEEAMNDVMPEFPEVVDVDDYLAAFSNPNVLEKFIIAENDEALREIIEKPLVKWRVFLHPKQRRLAENTKKGPVRVLGGAGTGKTVVAMHRAKWLAKNIATEDKKVLFTTFTKNLARDIKENLQTICSREEMKRIEVINLDSWVVRFLQKQGYDYRLLINSKEESNLWQEAYSEKPASIEFDQAFFKEEWSQVVQPQSVSSLDEYKKASRLGRGTRLNRAQRVEIWPVFEEYRRLLSRSQLKETDDAYRDATSFIKNNIEKSPSYCSIVVDEAQDMGSQAFNLIRAIVPPAANDLFLVGDAHQRIYSKNKVVLGRCGIEIRGRSSRLKINYRTTDETRKFAVSIIENVKADDLDGGEDTTKYYHSLMHGPSPEVINVDTPVQQAGVIKTVLGDTGLTLHECCVIARTNYELENIEKLLNNEGLKTYRIDGNSSSVSPDDCINLATMHRVKGLEFDAVFLASMNDNFMPLKQSIESANDDVSRRQRENEERSLVYVSLTRARKISFVLSYGQPSKYF
ncbi:MAG: mRNA-degrading endonuclease RelE of RelBE toxin-antitoxin system [Oleispira sp.]|jgi:mRNA-degrading endonuclease RelE of RelBE toxin-antitoxin system